MMGNTPKDTEQYIINHRWLKKQGFITKKSKSSQIVFTMNLDITYHPYAQAHLTHTCLLIEKPFVVVERFHVKFGNINN